MHIPRANDSIYGGVVPIFVKAALENREITLFGDGTQSRCFTFVKDTAKATALVLEKRPINKSLILVQIKAQRFQNSLRL